MTKHQAHISIDIPFDSIPQQDPSQQADNITRSLISILQQHLPLSFTANLDDVTDDPAPTSAEPIEWEVTCTAMEQWTRCFLVKAATRSDAIQYAMEHGVIDHEQFIDTENLSNWEAKPA